MIPWIIENFSNWDNGSLWQSVGAKYTMRMYDILKSAQKNTPFKTVNYNLLDDYRPEIFGLAMYPIFDETYRKELNDYIIQRFLEREIAYETDYLFRIHMQARMFEIMPKYNLLFTARLKMKSIDNIFETGYTNNSEETYKPNLTNENKFLDTPQNEVSNINSYLTNVNQSLNSGEAVTERVETNTGVNDSYGNIFQSLASCALDIEKQIGDELEILFMGVF